MASEQRSASDMSDAELERELTSRKERKVQAALDRRFANRKGSEIVVDSKLGKVTATLDTTQAIGTPAASGKSITYATTYQAVEIDGQQGYIRCTIGVGKKNFNLAPVNASTNVLK